MFGGNNGQEGGHRYHHAETGGKGNMALPFMLTQHSKNMTDYDERLEANPIKRGIHRVSFQKEPRAECIHWDILQLLDPHGPHPHTLFLCCISEGFSKSS